MNIAISDIHIYTYINTYIHTCHMAQRALGSLFVAMHDSDVSRSRLNSRLFGRYVWLEHTYTLSCLRHTYICAQTSQTQTYIHVWILSRLLVHCCAQNFQKIRATIL